MEYNPAEENIDNASHEHWRKNDQAKLNNKDSPRRRVACGNCSRRISNSLHYKARQSGLPASPNNGETLTANRDYHDNPHPSAISDPLVQRD